MSTNKVADHNLSSRGQEGDTGRSGNQTLSSVIESFMTGGSRTSSDITSANPINDFTNALRVLSTEQGSELATQLIASLENDFRNADGEKPKGVPQNVIDDLPRVLINDLPDKETADCPICTSRFIDDTHPLIVKLPCNLKKGGKAHIFDLECVGPWLEMNSTCPLCRFDVLDADRIRKEKLEEELRAAKEEDEDDEEEEWDDYG